ncbi:MAG TPA: nucleoside diphosphate kinase regulator [Pseudobdellovibrionaceae bacterium]|nr:nucleoside diphosphate kinase regulator [Pseudobdellovibrionaceae bacterium]
MAQTESLMITEQDYERLALLLQHTEGANSEVLEEELARATVVPQKDVPRDIVTMNSTVQFVSLDTKKESEVTLVYPKDADVTKGRVSILAPIGIALIGLRIGQTIQWPMPNGQSRELKVTGIRYQPEAAGDWDL